MSIYTDSTIPKSDPTKESLNNLKESQRKEFIIYLDNYVDITLGSLIRETKDMLSQMNPEETLILMVTNTRRTIEYYIINAYNEYGYYIQNLLKQGIKIAIIFRGIVELNSFHPFLDSTASKIISSSTIFYNSLEDSKIYETKTLIEKYKIEIL